MLPKDNKSVLRTNLFFFSSPALPQAKNNLKWSQGNDPLNRDFPEPQFLLSSFAIPGGFVQCTQLNLGHGQSWYSTHKKRNKDVKDKTWLTQFSHSVCWRQSQGHISMQAEPRDVSEEVVIWPDTTPSALYIFTSDHPAW